MKEQPKSGFVNVLAWIFIALAGLATLISILQNLMIAVLFPVEEMNQTFSDAQAREQIPLLFRLVFSNVQVFFLGFLVISSATFVSAIGLLKRKNWARRVFVGIMVLGILWNVLALFLHQSIFDSMPDAAFADMDPQFHTMMTVMKAFSFALAVGLTYLFGWIVYKLTSPSIQAEFLLSPPVPYDVGAGPMEPAPKPGRWKGFLIGYAVLTLGMAVYLFGTGPTKPAEKPVTGSVQRLVRSGDAAALAKLLRENPHVTNDVKEDSWSPIQTAACNGHTECVKLLVEAGADVNAQSCNRTTALHCGARNGNAGIVALLLEAHADPNLRDDKGKTPLDWALWNNHPHIVEILRKHRAKTGAELTGPQGGPRSESSGRMERKRSRSARCSKTPRIAG